MKIPAELINREKFVENLIRVMEKYISIPQDSDEHIIWSDENGNVIDATILRKDDIPKMPEEIAKLKKELEEIEDKIFQLLTCDEMKNDPEDAIIREIVLANGRV